MILYPSLALNLQFKGIARSLNFQDFLLSILTPFQFNARCFTLLRLRHRQFRETIPTREVFMFASFLRSKSVNFFDYFNRVSDHSAMLQIDVQHYRIIDIYEN